MITVGNDLPTSGASVVDVVGYGTGTTCFEGNGPTGATTATNAAFRKNDGALDTDNNATDFVVAVASPRNSPQNTAPSGIPPVRCCENIRRDRRDGPSHCRGCTPGTNPASSVITSSRGNLLAIGGSAAQDFTQDPVDANKFTFSATIGAALTSGPQPVSATIADSQGALEHRTDLR